MLIVQRLHVSWSPPVQRWRLRGDLGDEMQPDLRRDSLPRQPGWLYSPPGIVLWKPLKNFQSLNGFHKESHFPGREGGFGKMPKSSDWRNRPFANFRPRQTKVSPCLTLDWWSLHKLHHLTWIRFILASKTKVAFHHLIWIDLFSPLASLNKLVAACSDIRVNKEMSSIEVNTGHWFKIQDSNVHWRTILKKLKTEIVKASDCVNGTWLEDLGVTDYNTITKKYFKHRSWQNYKAPSESF